MIDTKAMALELEQARQARIEAETAYCDIEELLWQINHQQTHEPRIAYAFDGFGRAFANWTN